MPTEELTYYQRRAEAEIEMAQRSEHQRAVQAHYEMASAYLDRIHGESPQSDPNFLSA